MGEAAIETVPIGLKLRVVLQELQLEGVVVMRTKEIGSARLVVEQQVGCGGNGQVYRCTVAHHHLNSYLPAGCSQPLVPPTKQVVLKVATKPQGLSEEEESQLHRAAQLMTWREYDMLRHPKVQECRHVINTYGFGSARAEMGELLFGCERLPCMMLEWAELGSLWQQVAP